jgi:hypothetical protein
MIPLDAFKTGELNIQLHKPDPKDRDEPETEPRRE